MTLRILLLTAAIATQAADLDLQARLDQAIAAGLHEVTIAPGVYRLTPPKPVGPHLKLYGVSDLTIRAEGVTLLCTTLNTALWLEKCRNVRVIGPTIDYDPLPQTQGTIVALSPDHRLTDVRIHAGYPAPNLRPPGQAGHLWVADAATRTVRPGVYNRGYQALTDLGGGVWRLDHGHAIPDTAAVGDLIRLVQNWQSPHAVLLHLNDGVTLENVTIASAPGFGIVDRRSTGGVFRGVRIVPGPPPAGASEARLFSSWADGLNVSGCRVGPRIEGCSFWGTGDDAIAVYNESNLVARAEAGSEVVLGVTQYSPTWQVGDRARLFRYHDGTILDRAVTAVGPATVTPDELQRLHAASLPGVGAGQYAQGAVRLTLDGPVELAAGDIAVNWSCRGAGFRIADNVIVNGGSRGIVANMSGGEVRGNRITHTVLCGIHLFSFAHSEGGSSFQEDVAIADNEVAESCVTHPQRDVWQGAISVVNWDRDWPAADGHRNIRITGNTVRDAYGLNVQVSGASGVSITDNTFRDTHREPLGPTGPRRVALGALVLLDHVTGARLTGNRVVGLGPHGDRARLLVQTGGTSGVQGGSVP